jgi:hypothetical protein
MISANVDQLKLLLVVADDSEVSVGTFDRETM